MNRIAATVPESGAGIDPVANAFDAPYAVTTFAGTGGDGVCPLQGVVYLDGSSLSALTLATPTAGLPSAGGNDGQRLTIIAGSGKAHTVTTAANKIVDGASTGSTGDTLTFAAYAGAWAELMAVNGLWTLLGSVNVTLSEV